MFFLGISAHLFIYLLVPAFVIVCFYFRGITGNPEVNPILPEEVIVYEHSHYSFSKETYIYQTEKKKEPSLLKYVFYSVQSVLIEIPSYPCNFYLSPIFSAKPLRAPPTII